MIRPRDGAIDFSENDTKVLTISSTEPGDGKTTVIGSLAVAFAQGGKRILAIDGDMRRPGLTKLFDLGQRAGLSNVLKSDRPIEEVVMPLIYRPGLSNLDIIAAGPEPEVIAAVRSLGEAHGVHVYDDATGRPVDIPREDTPAATGETRGPGRPKLGVVAREVTLLPRHWEWLADQPGGASAALRRMIDAARKSDGDPGVETIWKGLTHVRIAAETLRLLRDEGAGGTYV